jgi:hypothetical protein
VRYIFECGKDRSCYEIYKIGKTYTTIVGWEICKKF